jgi:hypothetical protein
VPQPTATRAVLVNRAPVMTLWAAVVAERLGFDRAEALSLGRAVAGLNAQSKGRRLGVFKPHEEGPRAVRARKPHERFLVEVCGRAVPAVATADGIRAASGGKVIDPDAAAAYLEGKFGDNLKAVRAAMARLARGYAPAELARAAFALYEWFRPDVPEGKKGWGAKGRLDLDRIERLARGTAGR